MGVNNLIQFLAARFPEVFLVTASIEHFAGHRVYIDCESILQRSLHAASTAILARKRREHTRAKDAALPYVDARAIKEEILNHAARPLYRLNREFRAVRAKGGIKATFVLGSSLKARDLYISSKVGDTGHGTNILDPFNPHLRKSLKAFVEGKPAGRLYASPTEKDILAIAQRLSDSYAQIEIRQPDITRRCVEFCEADDHVLSDDTNAIAFGAPNVIRDYCGRNVCNTINQNRMLKLMGFDRAMFIDFCLLCGSNDIPLIPHIGPERAYQIIKSFGSLEAFLESPVYANFVKSPNVLKILEKRKMTVDQLQKNLEAIPSLREALNVRRAKT